MKKIQMVLLVSALFFPGNLFAQESITPAKAQNLHTEEQPNDLSSQKKQIKALFAKINTLQLENQELRSTHVLTSPAPHEHNTDETQALKSKIDQAQLQTSQIISQLEQKKQTYLSEKEALKD